MSATSLNLAAQRNPSTQPLAPHLADRWSPRGFDAQHEISVDELTSIIEAAQWSPSSSNTQPWHFLPARRGSDDFEAITGALRGFNQVWVPRASALIVLAAETERDGTPLRFAEYDLGQAAAHATMQAEHLGLRVHQMGGFFPERIAESFALPETIRPVALMAIGAHDSSDEMPDAIRERDAQPRTRRPLAEVLLRPIS